MFSTGMGVCAERMNDQPGRELMQSSQPAIQSIQIKCAVVGIGLVLEGCKIRESNVTVMAGEKLSKCNPC